MVPTAPKSDALHKYLEGMPWPKTDASHYHAQLRLLRQSSGNQRVGCLMGVGSKVTWRLVP